jgi:glycerol-3-phosphate O-acyltransferase/dihydroxyacetone phosphate acyltransferase
MFLNLLYDFLKLIVRIILRIFYPDTIFINEEGLKFDNPTIVVSNHPNTLLDAVGVAARVQKRLFFLANSSLFASPVAGWLLNRLYCIPIMRKEDAEKKQVNNDHSFQRAYEHLAGGGSIYIAPEGSSYMERRLRPLKSGTARIALGTEAANNWSVGVTILPVGLTYSNPHKFGSRLIFNVGAPIPVADYKEDYEKDPVITWAALTKLLEDRLKSHLTDTKDDEEDDLLMKLETLDLSEYNDQEQVFSNTQNRIPHLRAMDEDTYSTLRDKTRDYFELLEEKKTSDKAIWLQKNEKRTGKLWYRFLIVLLGLPVFLYGSINHLLAFGIPALVARLANLYIGYDSTVKTLVGLVTFPLFYLLQYAWVNNYVDASVAFVYLISLPVFGWLSWNYAAFLKVALSIFNFSRLPKKEKTEILSARQAVKSIMV